MNDDVTWTSITRTQLIGMDAWICYIFFSFYLTVTLQIQPFIKCWDPFLQHTCLKLGFVTKIFLQPVKYLCDFYSHQWKEGEIIRKGKILEGVDISYVTRDFILILYQYSFNGYISSLRRNSFISFFFSEIFECTWRLIPLLFVTVRPLDVRLLGQNTPLSAGSVYEMSCQTHGSRPPAHVTWHKDGLPLVDAPTRELVSADGNSTTSILSLLPQVEDSGKLLLTKLTVTSYNYINSIRIFTTWYYNPFKDNHPPLSLPFISTYLHPSSSDYTTYSSIDQSILLKNPCFADKLTDYPII